MNHRPETMLAPRPEEGLRDRTHCCDRTHCHCGLLRRHRGPRGPRIPLRPRGHRPGPGRRGRSRTGPAGVRHGHPDRRLRAAGHPRPGQHPFSPESVDHSRVRHRRDPVRLAADPVSDLGPADPGAAERGRRGQPGLAGPDRGYLEHRSPVRVPGGRGRPAGSGDPGRPPDRGPLPPDPRLDEPGAVGRRPAPRLGGRGPRHDPGRLAGRDRPLARPVPRLDDPHRRSPPARRSR